MPQIPDSDHPRVVIIGGGFAGINFAKHLRKQSFQIVLFDRNNYHTFQPLLYQVATAGLEPDSIADPLRKQLEPEKNFHFRMGEVYSINYREKIIKTEIGELAYDYLVIATGSKTNYFGNDQIMEHAFPLKQIPQALDLRSHLLQNFEAATITGNENEIASRMHIVIVGGGPTGVEVAGAIGELKKSVLPKDYPELDFSKMTITLVEGADRLLNGMSKSASEKALAYLKKFMVDVKLGSLIESYDGSMAVFKSGESIETHTVIWAAGVQGNFPAGLPENSIEKGRIKVNRFNEVEGAEGVYAIGDIAQMILDNYPKGLPMLAPVAIQQGEHLAMNMKLEGKGKERKPFAYKDKGSMATIGRNKAVVDLPGNLTFGGFFAWIIWMFVHLISIIGFRNRLIVFSNWVWNYFTYDKGTRLIIRRFVPKKERTNDQKSE